VPVEVTEPGVLFNVHVPTPGKPFMTTLPVAVVHVGWVMVPTTGATGVTGCTLITILAEAAEIQPAVVVMVYA